MAKTIDAVEPDISPMEKYKLFELHEERWN